MLRDYYLPLALPAAVIAWRTVLACRSSEKIGAASVTAIAGLVTCFVSVLCLASDIAEWYGVHFFALATLTMATMSICRQSERLDHPAG
jgi:4-hydroxybenzoate polyprenyltransferase